MSRSPATRAPVRDSIPLPTDKPIARFQSVPNAPVTSFITVAEAAPAASAYDPTLAAALVRKAVQQEKQAKEAELKAFQRRLQMRVARREQQRKHESFVRESNLDRRATELLSGGDDSRADAPEPVLGDLSLVASRFGVAAEATPPVATPPADAAPMPLEARVLNAASAGLSVRQQLVAHCGGPRDSPVRHSTAVLLASPRGDKENPEVSKYGDLPPHHTHNHLLTSTSTRAEDAQLFAKVRDQAMLAERLAVQERAAAVRAAEERKRAEEAAAKREAAAKLAAEEAERHRLRVEAGRLAATEAMQSAAARRKGMARTMAQRRSDEAKRFLEALRKTVVKRIEDMKLELPPLCNCPGSSVLEPSWETCANNCIYYRNPQRYTQALSDLLESLSLY